MSQGNLFDHLRGLTSFSLFGWLVADAWCWFVLREEYCWLVAGGWFVVREKYCWLVADKPSEQGYLTRPCNIFFLTVVLITNQIVLTFYACI
jgi:hypothetical protein